MTIKEQIRHEFNQYGAQIRHEYRQYMASVAMMEIEQCLLFERDDFACPYIEIVGEHNFYYVVNERGSEIERKHTTSIDELLYWLFRDITFSIGSSYTAKHCVPNQDSRRLMFAKSLELLERLNPAWRVKEEEYFAEILKSTPFEDTQE